MKILIFLMTAILVAGCTTNKAPSVAVAQSTPVQASSRDILANATIFGFGVRRGEKPTARKTDVAFRNLLSTPNATKQFIDIFNLGNVYSKLYALTAFHHLDKKLFHELATGMNKDEAVRVGNGCVYNDSTVGDIINEIESGRYDFVTKSNEKKNAEQKNALDQK